MNQKHFEEWFSEVLVAIPNKSVIVVDRAKYHRRVTDETKNPTTQWRKQDIIDWLKNKQISVPEPFSEFQEMTVPMLRNIAKKYPIENKLVIEKMADESGKDIKILWLPVAHCELNAIELVWAQLKSEIAKKNKTFKIKDVLTLCNDCMNGISPEKWKNCVAHVVKLENIIMEHENIIERERPAIQPIIIRIDGSDTESSSSSDSDSSNSSDSESEDKD